MKTVASAWRNPAVIEGLSGPSPPNCATLGKLTPPKFARLSRDKWLQPMSDEV